MPTLRFIDTHYETQTVQTFAFQPAAPLHWQAGQTIMISLLSDDIVRQRQCTISSSPLERRLGVTTRVTGDEFTSALSQLRAGDLVESNQPEGNFVWQKNKPAVMVSDSIGIVPFRAMLVDRMLRSLPLRAMLLHFSTENEDVPFQNDLAELSRQTKLELRFLQRPVDERTIKGAVGIFKKSAQVFLAGSADMVANTGDLLDKKGYCVKRELRIDDISHETP